MHKLILALTLLAPVAHAATSPKGDISQRAAKVAVAKALGPGLTGAGYAVSLGAIRGNSQQWNAFIRVAKNPPPGFLGPVVPPESGRINLKTSKVTIRPL